MTDANNNQDNDAFLQWWRRHHRDHQGDPADFARLRRCATPLEALLEPSTVELVGRLGAQTSGQVEIVAVIAAALAHVREHVPGKRFARQLGEKSDDRPALSPIRFNRLMRADDHDDRLTALRRALAIVKGRVDVVRLGRDLLSLLGFYGESARERATLDWTLEYHGARVDAARANEALATDSLEDAV